MVEQTTENPIDWMIEKGKVGDAAAESLHEQSTANQIFDAINGERELQER
jgi:hypothetical protein